MKKKAWIGGMALVVLLFFCLGCGEQNGSAKGKVTGDPDAMGKICDPSTYDLDCIKSEETSLSDEVLDVGGDLFEMGVDALGGEVSDERQDRYGEQTKKEIAKQFPIQENHPKLNLLEGLLHKLLKMRRNPTEIDYNIYVILSDMVNAFTVGGEIFVTTTLLEQVESTDELACVIGHEIGHNELGHLADQIKKQEAVEDFFGEEAGRTLSGIADMLTIGFNQKKEAESDMFGIDLAISSGYNACRGIDFWRRMEKLEPEANELDNFIRSHPYSDRRMKCYRSHLSAHHKLDCQ